MTTLKQLIARRDRAEEALAKETERIHNILDNQGWGHGMRCSNTGCSFKKEDTLKERIRNLNAQIAEMKKKEEDKEAKVRALTKQILSPDFEKTTEPSLF